MSPSADDNPPPLRPGARDSRAIEFWYTTGSVFGVCRARNAAAAVAWQGGGAGTRQHVVGSQPQRVAMHRRHLKVSATAAGHVERERPLLGHSGRSTLIRFERLQRSTEQR